MNIIVAIIFCLKRAPECIEMPHFEEHAKIFLGGEGAVPLLRLHPHWGGVPP